MSVLGVSEGCLAGDWKGSVGCLGGVLEMSNANFLGGLIIFLDQDFCRPKAFLDQIFLM